MKCLAIIPARGGSKRIPKKNIKDFLGKPIIAYSIECALQCSLFDEVMVSTDDNEIAEIAVKYGAKTPFKRSAINADDIASTEDVILEVLDKYKQEGKLFEYVCCIYPTAPLITAEQLVQSKNKLIDGAFDTIFPVLKYGHPVQRALKKVDGNIQPVWPECTDLRSQDLESYYHDAGQFYWININKFKTHHQLHSPNSGFIEVAENECHDIDNMSDWIIAELKFKAKNIDGK